MTNKEREKLAITSFTLLVYSLIILKLLGFISWSWFWVLTPVWLTFSLLLVLITFIIIKNILGEI